MIKKKISTLEFDGDKYKVLYRNRTNELPKCKESSNKIKLCK